MNPCFAAVTRVGLARAVGLAAGLGLSLLEKRPASTSAESSLLPMKISMFFFRALRREEKGVSEG
jgi:hypothetical protein